MKTSNEMFEELGHKESFHNYYEHDFGTTIHFQDSYTDIKIQGTIHVRDLQAINKKCQELGWI